MESKKGFQERLREASIGFDKLIHVLKIPKSSKQEVIITYKGEESLDGVYSDNQDITIRQVENFGNEVRIRVVARAQTPTSVTRAIVVYFDKEEPFYIKDGDKVIPNPSKLKQSIQFQITGINEFDTYEYNFGEVVEGDIIKFEFNYTGSDKIQGVKGTCGCTDVNLEGNRIYGALSTEGLVGNVAKTVNVYFGDYARNFESINGILIPNKDSKVVTLAIRGNTISRNT